MEDFWILDPDPCNNSTGSASLAGGMQDRGLRTGGIKGRRDAGQVGSRKDGMQDR